ncbi:MAG: CDGSH iron-sulfur domain-containing protein [Dehalococcoidia bacterium]
MPKVTITETADGPLVIDGRINLIDAGRNEIATRGKARLCRCGMSNAKPFCDNSHQPSDFGAESGQSEEEFLNPKPVSRRREYSGDGLKVSFDASLCIHVGECLRLSPEVFDLRSRPWINLEGADVQKIVDTVRACPSGALRYELDDPESVEIGTDDEDPPVVRAWRNGPIRVKGKVKIVSKDGKTVLEGDRVSLCRCGASRNKPFCDNSHQLIKFEAST